MSLLHAFASGSILAGAWELSHSWPLCVGIFAFLIWTHLRFNEPADTTEAG